MTLRRSSPSSPTGPKSTGPASTALAGRPGGGVGSTHLRDRSFLAADRAVRIAAHLHFAEARRLRVEREQPADQWLSVTRYQFECLVGLKRPDDAWEHAQDPCFASGRGQ